MIGMAYLLLMLEVFIDPAIWGGVCQELTLSDK